MGIGLFHQNSTDLLGQTHSIFSGHLEIKLRQSGIFHHILAFSMSAIRVSGIILWPQYFLAAHATS